MERGLILLIAALLYVVTAVHGSSHLSFSNNTEFNITRDGCGVSKVCLEYPDDCDPTGTTNCLFGSVTDTDTMSSNGTNLSFKLRGESMGYIAMGFTVNSTGTTMLFICTQNASNTGAFVFITTELNNTDNTLERTERMVTEISGVVNGSFLQCEFNVPNVNATYTTLNDTTFKFLLGNGTYDGTTIGPFQKLRDSTDPSDNASSTTSPTPTSTSNSNSTSSSGVFLPNAGLLLLTVVTLPAMLRG